MTATQDAPSTTSGRPTTHQGILDFVNEVAALTKPDRIHWCTGSDEEWTELTEALMATGTFTQLEPGDQAELVLRRLRPDRRRAGRGPHLHLLGRREGLRAHQQLDGPRAR